MNRLRLVFAATLLSATIIGCGGKGESPTAPQAAESITITTVAPPNGTKLTPRASVTIAATISAQETCDGGGTITMTVRDQNGNILSPDIRKTIDDGPHSVTFSATFTVPANGVSRVDVEFDLQDGGLCCVLCAHFVQVSYPVG